MTTQIIKFKMQSNMLLGFRWTPKQYYDMYGRRRYIMIGGCVAKLIATAAAIAVNTIFGFFSSYLLSKFYFRGRQVLAALIDIIDTARYEVLAAVRGRTDKMGR